MATEKAKKGESICGGMKLPESRIPAEERAKYHKKQAQQAKKGAKK